MKGLSAWDTLKRCTELLETIQQVLSRKRVDVKDLERLHGRLFGLDPTLLAENFFFARGTAVCALSTSQ